MQVKTNEVSMALDGLYVGDSATADYCVNGEVKAIEIHLQYLQEKDGQG